MLLAELPHEAVQLATSPLLENHRVVLFNAVVVGPHPEASEELLGIL